MAGVVDFVGYGAANDYGRGPARHPPCRTPRRPSAASTASPTPATTPTDFTVAGTHAQGPGARRRAAAGVDCAATPTAPACVPGTTTIQDIQGTGFLSTLNKTTVERVAGIVTAVRSNRGFWIQQPTRDDSRPSASSGIFVFTAAAPTVAVGDSVLVTGRGLGLLPEARCRNATTASLSITEITPTVVTSSARATSLPPAPGRHGDDPFPAPTRPPATGPGFNIETITPVEPDRSALEFWEAHEGMLVTVNDVRVVGPGNSSSARST